MGPSSCRKTSSGLPLILHYGELYNYFIIYYNVIIIEVKCTINVKNKTKTNKKTVGALREPVEATARSLSANRRDVKSTNSTDSKDAVLAEGVWCWRDLV